MYRILDNRGTGKTSRLMLLAKEYNAIIVCSNPKAMEEKAHAYGIIGIDFISYNNFIQGQYSRGKKILIDELDCFLQIYNLDILGYDLSIDEV